MPVRILSHHGNWIEAEVTRWNRRTGVVDLTAKAQIEGGTSGGPVIDSRGRLLAIISHTTQMTKMDTECTGEAPIACWALPRWILLAIREAQRERDSNGPDIQMPGVSL